MVRHGSAKAVFVGSIPTLASKNSETPPCREMWLKGRSGIDRSYNTFSQQTRPKIIELGVRFPIWSKECCKSIPYLISDAPLYSPKASVLPMKTLLFSCEEDLKKNIGSRQERERHEKPPRVRQMQPWVFFRCSTSGRFPACRC